MLFIMRGASCSGKDTFINQTFGESCPHVISSDDMRVKLTGDVSKQDYNTRVFELMEEFVKTRVLNGADYTVINATNLRMKDTRRFIELGKELKSRMVMISIAPPAPTELIKRAEARELEGGLRTPDGVLYKHYERYENCKKAFLNEATYNDLFQFIEINQEQEVIRHVK